jgi:hypothetical protein
MKKLKLFFIFSLLLIALGVGNAWAVVGLPTANFSGNAQTTGQEGDDPGALTLINDAGTITYTTISQVNYLDGTSTELNGYDESILGMYVKISGATRIDDVTFTDAVITVSDGLDLDSSFKYFSATLSNIMFVQNPADGKYYLNPGLDVNNPSTLNMTNVVLLTDDDHPSRYINELESIMSTSGALGMKMILELVEGDFAGNSKSDISIGLLDGTPPPLTEAPAGARSQGFWKNHDEERNSFINTAVALSNIFSTADQLNDSLCKKGKKTMEEKVKLQLAALMLNVASSLPLTTEISSGELEILQALDVTTAGESTVDVDDALWAIENAILTGVDLELAKDLAEEINNRDH